MNVHVLKCWPESFIPILEGRKRLELRKNDRGFANDDHLLLKEFIPCQRCGGTGRMWDVGDKMECVQCGADHGVYTGSTVRCLVTHILTGIHFGLQEGYVAMSIVVIPMTTPPEIKT